MVIYVGSKAEATEFELAIAVWVELRSEGQRNKSFCPHA